MKKTFTFLLALLFTLSAFAQEVEEVQRTVITKRTATWCPPCGSWGWAFMEQLIEDNDGKAVLIAAHMSSSSLGNSASAELTDNWGAFGQPLFYVNEVNQNASSANMEEKRTAIKEQVDAAFDSQPVANVGFAPVYQNGEIKVDAKVKFFQEAAGDFYLGIYLLEDNVFANQAGGPNDNIHDRVMQYSFTDSTWGLPFMNGTVDAGTEFTLSYSLPIGSPEGVDYHVVGIIYKLDGGIYKPVNVWSTQEIDLDPSSGVGQVSGLSGFEINPTIVGSSANIQLELSEFQAQSSLDLVDINGRTVANLFSGDLSAGTHVFEISRDEVSTGGVYFVRFSSGGQVSTKRVVFQ